MPDLRASLRGLRWPRRSAGEALAATQPLRTLQQVREELGEAEGRIDEALERERLPEQLLRTRAWDRGRARVLATPGLDHLCGDLDAAYAELRRIGRLRTGRIWQMYATRPGDGVEQALERIRHALDALDMAIDRAAVPPRPTLL